VLKDEIMEDKQTKKKYETPKVTRIRLDAKCAVLGFCKQAATGSGPAQAGCQDALFAPCVSQGS
jgi:hypothetical protein